MAATQLVITEYFRLFEQALAGDATPEQLRNSKKVFFAGAFAVLSVVSDLAQRMENGTATPEQIDEQMAALQAEIEEFRQAVAKGGA